MIDSYKTLTIRKYQELRSLDTQGMEEIDIQVAFISILNEMDEDAVLNLPINEYKALVVKLGFLNTLPNANHRPPRKIILNGHKYELLRGIDSMSAGQYIDYETYLSENKIDSLLPQILSCFVIPQGKKYGEYDVAEVIEDIKEMPLEDALCISNFFFLKSQRSINNTLRYLEWTMKRLRRKKTMDEETKKKMEVVMEMMRRLRTILKGGLGFRQSIQ